ncbi:MAG: hypothetical protein OXF73_14045 [Gammaproteobacteria bacterium]|nr:hypothetical protein [Gammaproteobacteria bacterium]
MEKTAGIVCRLSVYVKGIMGIREGSNRPVVNNLHVSMVNLNRQYLKFALWIDTSYSARHFLR